MTDSGKSVCVDERGTTKRIVLYVALAMGICLGTAPSPALSDFANNEHNSSELHKALQTFVANCAKVKKCSTEADPKPVTREQIDCSAQCNMELMHTVLEWIESFLKTRPMVKKKFNKIRLKEQESLGLIKTQP
ncbi:MAG: hypothetical protein HOI80_04950 [Alphaproteobacteria bacterium]|nr:hypothetical protein [Alphaproteobacteria bacterium]MBT5390436.1 hypothetical protein [Alphaproteobacteria bacterium]MBT5540735.1 hypothetical protein [Alphaproteobacteria bacterium]MBT5654825.1 hypothetical protein [Alphaproteobacteria bacterium]